MTDPIASRTVPAKSRWRRSEVTFGPVGRIVASFLVIVPVIYFSRGNILFLIAAAVWLIRVVPLALRDIWRPVRNPDAPATLIVPPELGPPAPGESINDRPVPQRW